MTITPDDLKEFDLPYAPVWERKHDYMPDGYTIMSVTKIKDGFEGGMVLPHLSFDSARFAIKAETFEKCRVLLEQHFSRHLPDHTCGAGCTDWHPSHDFFKAPSGRTQ
jgi:hypothetical protein